MNFGLDMTRKVTVKTIRIVLHCNYVLRQGEQRWKAAGGDLVPMQRCDAVDLRRGKPRLYSSF